MRKHDVNDNQLTLLNDPIFLVRNYVSLSVSYAVGLGMKYDSKACLKRISMLAETLQSFLRT